MKKLAFVLLSVSATVFGLGMVAEAQQVPYGETNGNITLSPPTSLVGSSVTVGVTGCTPDEGLTVAIDNVSGSTTTCSPSGGASFVIKSPDTAGTYTVSVAGDGGFAANASLVVTAAAAAAAAPTSGALPATGSDGVNTTLALAGGLLAVGVALFVVAQLRRRRNVTVA